MPNPSDVAAEVSLLDDPGRGLLSGSFEHWNFSRISRTTPSSSDEALSTGSGLA
jgi:hypothetical protein